MFELDELMEGKVALFNMWDMEMSENEIKSVNCVPEGNLLSMFDMLTLGPADFSEEQVPCESDLQLLPSYSCFLVINFVCICEIYKHSFNHESKS